MYQAYLHQELEHYLIKRGILPNDSDRRFWVRFMANLENIHSLFLELYGFRHDKNEFFQELLELITQTYLNRAAELKNQDREKEEKGHWFLSSELAGMSLYVDRFAGNLKEMPHRLSHFQELGVNLLHLMPLFQSPATESDGGYAVSDFQKVDSRFGNLDDLKNLGKIMREEGMYLMLDIVLNHTSRLHPWAIKAKSGDPHYQEYYHMYSDRYIPDQFEQYMPEIFPDTSPGNFTYVEEVHKWVMTVFHSYQWDLNFANPRVFLEMMGNIYFYANLGVDILRVDAPAFIWKELGTSCQNQPKAHTLLRLIKLCIQTASPGMALLGEAIVAPSAIIKYFGTDYFHGKECDLAYNASQMALQWEALATGKTRVMLEAQSDVLQKPYGCTWLTYTRCHDDIGLVFEDDSVRASGFNPWDHKNFIKDYYTGKIPGSESRGELFSYNPKNHDARLSGTLASLCGLEKALEANDPQKIEIAIQKILLMQAQSMFIGGIPMLFYGDELGYTNDYSYLNDSSKSYDNRWMHRPSINWEKNARIHEPGSVEERIFSGTRQLLSLRKSLEPIGDYKNIQWLSSHNDHIAGFIRAYDHRKIYCLFNYQGADSYLTWFIFKEHGHPIYKIHDLWENKEYTVGLDHEYLVIKPYSFMILETYSQ